MPRRRATPKRSRAALVPLVATLIAGGVLAPGPVAWGAPPVQVAALPAPPRQAVAIPFPLSHLGVRWTGSEGAVVQVRTAPRPGAWGRWQRLEVAHDLGNAARRLVLSGLVRADGARLVEVRTSGDARRPVVVAIDAVGGRRRPVRTPTAAAGAAVPQPPVVSRGHWGADESMRRGTPVYAPVSKVVVHHTVTPNDDPDPASTMRAIYAYHVRGNGWDDIGYNFVIDSSGRVYEGRFARAYAPGETPTGESVDGRGVVGAHAAGNNDGSVGVALLGTFTDRAPSSAAVDALQRLLAWEAERHRIDATGTTTWSGGRTLPTIAGHRDVGTTECPGGRLHDALPSVRQAVADIVADALGTTRGYWTLARDGRVFPFGEARAAPGPLGSALVAPAAAMAPTPSGAGYWVLGEGGRVVPFGDAPFFGSPELAGLRGRALRIEPTPSGLGYWVLEADGTVAAFGDARPLGSLAGATLKAPVVSMTRTPSGNGYWLVAADGGVFSFGDARFLGSTGAIRLAQPIVAVAATPDGLGYWLVARDGGVFAFGRARYAGSLPQLGIRAGAIQARATASGRGYYLLGDDGAVFSFGDARFHGARPDLGPGGAVDLALQPGSPGSPPPLLPGLEPARQAPAGAAPGPRAEVGPGVGVTPPQARPRPSAGEPGLGPVPRPSPGLPVGLPWPPGGRPR